MILEVYGKYSPDASAFPRFKQTEAVFFIVSDPSMNEL
jgi:hypothetical protein